MRQKSGTRKAPAEQVIKDIRRATRKQYSPEETIRIVLEGLRGEESIAVLRKEVVAEQALELRLLKKSVIADGGDDE